MDKLNKAD